MKEYNGKTYTLSSPELALCVFKEKNQFHLTFCEILASEFFGDPNVKNTANSVWLLLFFPDAMLIVLEGFSQIGLLPT